MQLIFVYWSYILQPCWTYLLVLIVCICVYVYFLRNFHTKDHVIYKKDYLTSFFQCGCLLCLVSFLISSIQFSSVAQSCPTLCNPMDCSTPGFPVHHQLPEFSQTHVHQVGDAIQPSYPLSSPSPPAFNLSQHQGLFQMSQFFASGGQSIGVSASASVLPMNIQDWSPLEWTGWISVQSKGLSRVFSSTTLQKLQFFCTLLSLTEY